MTASELQSLGAKLLEAAVEAHELGARRRAGACQNRAPAPHRPARRRTDRVDVVVEPVYLKLEVLPEPLC